MADIAIESGPSAVGVGRVPGSRGLSARRGRKPAVPAAARRLAAAGVLTCAVSWIGACAATVHKPTALDGALRGREIDLHLRAGPDGFRIEGRLFVAVPPLALARLLQRPARLLRAFPDHVVGAARWPKADDERLFFAAKLFGRVFKAWGNARRTFAEDHARVDWRTDKGALGSAQAWARGRGSEVTFTSFFPRKVDLARFIGRFGVELGLRVMAFAVRARLETLWRQGLLSETPRAEDGRASSAGLTPPEPWWPGTPVPPTLRRWVTPAPPGTQR